MSSEPNPERRPLTKRAFPTTCIFCLSSSRSKEHIVAQWLHPYLPPLAGRSQQAIVRLIDGQQKISAGPDHGSSHGYSKTLKVVCKTCNNEWMSRLQNRARPWLEPICQLRWPQIGEAGQRALAAWATMFAIVAEYMDHEMAAVSLAERVALMTTEEPLPNWQIWLGSFERGDRSVLNHHGLGMSFGGQERPEVLNTQVSTFTVGRAFFHCISTTSGMELVDADLFASDLGLTRIWPLGAPMTPPPTAHDFAGVMEVANRFHSDLGILNVLGSEPVSIPPRRRG